MGTARPGCLAALVVWRAAPFFSGMTSIVIYFTDSQVNTFILMSSLAQVMIALHSFCLSHLRKLAAHQVERSVPQLPWNAV